jgi:nucleoside-triphosphatase
MTSLPKPTHILLLTGTPGIGKSTLIGKVVSQLSHYRIGGFYTEEIREAGKRKGFRLVTFNGEEGIMAHVNFDHHYRVSKYGVDVAMIDHFADTTLTLTDDIDVYLIDEIGKMECFSQRFVTRVETLLNSSKPVIATIAKKGSGLIEKAKQWPGSELWELTFANRDARVAEVSKWLATHCE